VAIHDAVEGARILIAFATGGEYPGGLTVPNSSETRPVLRLFKVFQLETSNIGGLLVQI
jgi:hypothetical protein